MKTKMEDSLDVTVQSGIERPIFGLGPTVSDINNDGWLDFIASDYYIPDALFINNQDGTFTDKITSTPSRFRFMVWEWTLPTLTMTNYKTFLF